MLIKYRDILHSPNEKCNISIPMNNCETLQEESITPYLAQNNFQSESLC